MYHVTITDSDGKIVSESDGKVLLLAHYISEDDGVLGLSLCNDGTIREQLCTIDAVETMRDKMMKDNPELTLLYMLKDAIIGGREEIDFSSLREFTKGLGDE